MEPSETRKQFRLPTELVRKMEELARNKGISLNDNVLLAVTQFVEQSNTGYVMRYREAMRLIEIWNIQVSPLLRKFETQFGIADAQALDAFNETKLGAVVDGAGTADTSGRTVLIDVCNWLEYIAIGIAKQVPGNGPEIQMLANQLIGKKIFFQPFTQKYDAWLRAIQKDPDACGWPELNRFWDRVGRQGQ